MRGNYCELFVKVFLVEEYDIITASVSSGDNDNIIYWPSMPKEETIWE